MMGSRVMGLRFLVGPLGFPILGIGAKSPSPVSISVQFSMQFLIIFNDAEFSGVD